MKQLAFALILTLIFCFIGCADRDTDSSASVGLEVSSIPYDTGQTQEEPEYMIDFFSFEMTLVNPWKPLKEGFVPELEKIDPKYCPSGLYFAKSGLDALHELCAAAANEGIKLEVVSAWRSFDTQTRLFNNKIERVKKANPNLTEEQAEAEAATVVARPGTSEHQLGLAVDFNSVEDDFKYTDEYEWLKENSYKYGFILRYTEDKQVKTGIISEPWHYRYVGKENAKMITESGLCLEEFIDKYNTFM